MEKIAHKNRIFELADKLKKGEMSLDDLINQIENGTVQLYAAALEKRADSDLLTPVHTDEASAVLGVIYDDIVSLFDELIPGSAQERADFLANDPYPYEVTLGEYDDKLARKASPELARRLDEFDESFGETEDVIRYFLGYRDLLRDEVGRRKRAKDKKRGSSHLPYIVPVNTSREIKTSLQAVADGKTLRNWENVQGEIALRHVIPGEKFETKLTTADEKDTYESLKSLLKEWGGLECALQFQFVFEAVLLHERAYLDLDDLIRELRWNVHSVEERQEMREKVFKRLNLFSQIASYGERPEIYTDSLTKEKNKVFSRGPFIRLLDHYFTEQQIKDKETVPIGVTAVAGDWANQHRGNRQILHAIGNARRLVGLSTGQASGEWALSIGLTLLQYWRQAANKHSRVERVGEKKELTIIFDKPFTRFQLLDLFPPSKFPVAEMLKSKNPGRARSTWDKAIDLLKKQGVISYYAQLNKKELPPQRWQNTWLEDETFDIRPATEAKNDAIEINQSGKKLRDSWVKKNGSKTKAAKAAKN
jgi:hypothetical protein